MCEINCQYSGQPVQQQLFSSGFHQLAWWLWGDVVAASLVVNLFRLKAAEVSGIDGWSLQSPETPSSQQHWDLAAGQRGREDQGSEKLTQSTQPASCVKHNQETASSFFMPALTK